MLVVPVWVADFRFPEALALAVRVSSPGGMMRAAASHGAMRGLRKPIVWRSAE
jgi:hypothetical protein